MIEEVREKFSLTYASLAEQLGLGYTTLMRWKRRIAAGTDPVGKRGPKKVQPLNLAELKGKIQGLDHKKKRTHGTGRLHREYGGSISRRELNEMVREVRTETNRKRAAEMCHVTWLVPNLAWALDDCRKSKVLGNGPLYLHDLSDLCSRYRLPPIASKRLVCGEEVAGHLAYLFHRFGPPLFCKRDNCGNLNHTAVDQVLGDALVIPINSPPVTPEYNGAVEHTQGEFKSYLERWQWKADSVKEFSLLAEAAAHDLNHQPRRCLEGRTACSAYFDEDRPSYPKRERRSVYRWIQDLASDISERADQSVISPTAWRVAARQWLLKKGLIKIEKAGEVSPHFLGNWCHN